MHRASGRTMHPWPCEKARTPQGLPIDRPWRVACGTPDATGPREHDAASALRRGQDPPRPSDRSSLGRGVWYPPDATSPREDHAALVLWNGLGLSWPPIDRAWREACGVSHASSKEDTANRNAGKKGHFSEAPDRPDRLASIRDLAPQMLPWRWLAHILHDRPPETS